jgi:hypothetical protein
LIFKDSVKKCVDFPDILHFITAIKRIPAIGFEKFLTIDFTDTAIPPTVTTCALSITFSSSMSNLSYVKFYKTMDRYVALVDLETLKL